MRLGIWVLRVPSLRRQHAAVSKICVFSHWLIKCYACLTHSSVTSSMTDASGAPHSRLRTRNMSSRTSSVSSITPTLSIADVTRVDANAIPFDSNADGRSAAPDRCAGAGLTMTATASG